MTMDETGWRKELEAAGETAVRDDMKYGGGFASAGEPKRAVIRRWLREKDAEKQTRDLEAYNYMRRTYYTNGPNY